LGQGYSFHRQCLLERLRQAEDRVLQGEQFILQQRETILRGEAHGWDVELRRSLLSTFEELQQMRVEDRDRLLSELARDPDSD
jgi:hypothetical protein